MARSVDSTLVLPTRSTTARMEIADHTGRGSGWHELMSAVNTLLEQYRGSLVCDVDPAGVYTQYSQSHPYRVPVPGELSSGESVDVWVYGRADRVGQVTIRASSIGTGDLTSLLINDTTLQWRFAGSFEIGTSGSDYDSITVGWDGGMVTAHPEIYAICIFFSRARTVLPAVGSGDLAYPEGSVPHDLVSAAGERVLTATRGRQPHDNLRLLYARAWPFVASSHTRSPWSDDRLWWRAEVPPQIEPRDITARLYAYVTYTGNGTGLQIGSLNFSASGHGAVGGGVSSSFTGWLGPFDISVRAPAEGIVRPRLGLMGLSANEYLQVRAISGWWSGLTYGV